MKRGGVLALDQPTHRWQISGSDVPSPFYHWGVVERFLGQRGAMWSTRTRILSTFIGVMAGGARHHRQASRSLA